MIAVAVKFLVSFGRRLWDALNRAAKWLWENPIALGLMIGGVIGAWFVWKSKKNQIASLEDAVAVEATRRKIAKSEARAELLEKSAAAREPEVQALKEEIATSKRRVLELRMGSDLSELSDAEVARIFTESGL